VALTQRGSSEQFVEVFKGLSEPSARVKGSLRESRWESQRNWGGWF